MIKSEDNSEPSGDPGSSGERAPENFRFAGAEEMDALFAGAFLKNLSRAEKHLRVSAASRGLALKISSSEPENTRRFSAFLEELRKLAPSGGKRLDQHDFDRILEAFRTSSENGIRTFFANRIKVSPKKRDIAPRTANQLAYVQSIRGKDLIFGVGPAGTGKTYLAMALAVSELLAGNFNRIVMTRPAVEAGENLGFLPGKLEDKINPYLRPLYDALYDMLEFDEANSLIERGIVEVAPLAFMRGRTLTSSFIILDEAQNTTNEQMLMLLTRIGFNSKCVVAGDPSQIDLPNKRASGLANAVRRLSAIPEIAVCRFNSDDVLRHSLVEKIIGAYRNGLCADPAGAGKTIPPESLDGSRANE